MHAEGRWVFARFWVFPRPNIKKRFSRTFLMEFLDIRRRNLRTVHGWRHLSWFGISASSVMHKRREFSNNQPSHIFPPTVVLRTLFLILNMLRAHYISMSLATVIWECSLNQFSTSLFVSLFVNREPQQIFMGENTEYRANLVKARVNFPVTLLHIYWVCQYKLFLISEGWEGLSSISLKLFVQKLPCCSEFCLKWL